MSSEIAGALPVQHVACPHCGADDPTPWGRQNGFTACRCGACGFVYVNPRPRDDQISEATQTGQHRHEAGAIDVVYKPSRRKLARYRRRIARVLGPELRSGPVSWLDIGAGFGELMEALGDLLPPGSRVVGVEPMVPKAEHARARGLDVTSRGLDELGERFDYVSLVNIFSHLPDPRGFLRQVRGLLKPGGVLVLVTGNGGDLPCADDYPDSLDLPDHLAFAGRRHVEETLEALGLQVFRVDQQRLDTATWALKSLAKRAMGRRVPLVLPYRSAFRDTLFLARAPG